MEDLRFIVVPLVSPKHLLYLKAFLTTLLLTVLGLTMKRLVSGFFGGNVKTNDSTIKTTSRALPAQWYRSDDLYELERRAIFSRKWLLITHKLRFAETGDWIKYEEAGFQFFIVKDRSGAIRGFHNVCRHRAFPLVTEEKGQSKIFACKYHGWSYGLNGSLAKAPGYQDIESFDKSQNGLWPIHIKIDAHGFIWVNLDAKPVPEVAWEDDFLGIDKQARHEPFNFEDYNFDHTWGMSGDYNWKTLADNYNECYHCAIAHPDAAAVADLTSYKVETRGGNIEHFANTKAEHEQAGLKVVSNYYFPNACMSVTPHFFYMMRCVPTSAKHCSMEYEVYRHKNSSDEDFERIDSMFKRILSEDKWLCNNAQKNLNAGVFVNGEMHSTMEQGPLFFQSTVRETLEHHWRMEEVEGREIWPARQALPKEAALSRKDVEFCSGVACNEKTNRSLLW